MAIDVLFSDVVTCYEGMDGYALVDKAPYEWMKREIERLNARVVVMEDSLCSAVCIIRNEAGLNMLNRDKEGENRLNRWADELIAESGMDFRTALSRVAEPEGPDAFGVIQEPKRELVFGFGEMDLQVGSWLEFI